MSTTPVLGLVSIRTWFLTIASSSLMRASIMPCSFFAAWYSKFSERSPNSRAALILATMAGRRTVVSWSSSFRTATSPSGVMWTSLVINWSLGLSSPPLASPPCGEVGPAAGAAGRGEALSCIVPNDAQAAVDRRDATHGHGARRRRRRLAGRDLAPAARPGGRHPRLGRRRGARDRADGRRGQPRRQRRLGPGRDPLRIRRARLRNGVLRPVARHVSRRA